jgi:hypothetical protein
MGPLGFSQSGALQFDAVRNYQPLLTGTPLSQKVRFGLPTQNPNEKKHLEEALGAFFLALKQGIAMHLFLVDR